MALKANVLAQLMEAELDTLYQATGKGPLGNVGRTDRVMLFTALAKAIVDHITADAVVEVSDVNLWKDPATGVIK